jgi:predicted AAA+ superfamily ATPase
MCDLDAKKKLAATSLFGGLSADFGAKNGYSSALPNRLAPVAAGGISCQIESEVYNLAYPVDRALAGPLRDRLKQFPVVALLGPRQCGKTWLAKRLVQETERAVYLDLERPSDLARLQDPEAFFALHSDALICLDEIQRAPDLFATIRSDVDVCECAGRFLILGSASRDLLRQSAESLAGRIAYLELAPFRLDEVTAGQGDDVLRRLWLRGGFPRSYLAATDAEAAVWLDEFVRMFLERDLPQLAGRVDVGLVGRLWRMLAHVHGGMLNASALGSALGVSAPTVRAWLDLLEKAFVVRLLQPFEANLGKRLVKTPRVYLRDVGLLHSLLGVRDHDALLGHPSYGASWEGLVLEHAIAALPDYIPSFYRTRAGAEMDLVLEQGHRRVLVECKASSAPKVTRGFWTALDDLKPDAAFVVAPVAEAYPLGRGAMVVPLAGLAARLR